MSRLAFAVVLFGPNADCDVKKTVHLFGKTQMTTRLMELEFLTQGLARALTEAGARLRAIEELIRDIRNDEHTSNMMAKVPKQ